MPHRHQPAATTHTVELQQVLEINRCLAEAACADITAEVLGVAGTPTAAPPGYPLNQFGTELRAHPVLRPAAALRHLSAEGPPRFPYVLGHFGALAVGGQRSDAALVIELHSAVLARLSGLLRLRHCWGSDAVLAGKAIR